MGTSLEQSRFGYPIHTGTQVKRRPLFEVQHHRCRVLQIRSPEVGKTAHSGSINYAVVRRPAYTHYVGFGDNTLSVKSGQHLQITGSLSEIAFNTHACPVLMHIKLKVKHIWLN